MQVDSSPSGYLLARTFLIIAKQFISSGGGTSIREISTTLQVNEITLSNALDLMLKEKLIFSVGEDGSSLVLPGRPLDQVTVDDLYRLAENQGYAPGSISPSRNQTFESLVLESESAARLVRRQQDFADLVKQPETAEPED